MIDQLVPSSLTLLRLFVVLCALVALTTLIRYAVWSQRPRGFPTGPRTVPILGNLHQFPKSHGFLKFREWGRKYGSIIGLKLGPQNVVILNDYRHVKELFDKKGAIYSDRPPNHIANDIICPNQSHVLFSHYGDKWRSLRKTMQGILNIKAVDSMLPIQEAEATVMLHQLVSNPAKWYDHIRRYSTSVILASIYGLRGATFDSPRVKALYHVQDQFTQITEIGATPPTDAFPILKLLPDFLSPWRAWAKEVRRQQKDLYFGLMQETKVEYKVSKTGDYFLLKMLRDQEANGYDDEQVAYLGGALMEGGSDTTASTLLSFILAMVQVPEALAKCQQEVDSICGVERSPNIGDRDSLVYLKAAMTETLRWRPVAANGIPHALTQDDYHEGFYLPKGTILFASPWVIHRSSEFEDPDDFHPERFLDNKFGVTGDAEIVDDKRRVTYAFGAGRRVCPGQRLAENSLLITMAKLVWAFNLKPGPGFASQPIETGYFGGFLIAPKPYALKLDPRSSAHVDVINREYKQAMDVLSHLKH